MNQIQNSLPSYLGKLAIPLLLLLVFVLSQTVPLMGQSKQTSPGFSTDPADATNSYPAENEVWESPPTKQAPSRKGKGGEKMLVMGCDLTTYQTATLIGPADFPYTSPGTGVTVSVSTNVTTIPNTTYSCDGNSFACSNPAWWLQSTSESITLTFSSPVTDFSVVVNGTNQGEVFTFTAATGTVSLDNFCTASFAVTGGGNQLVDNVSSTTGTLITVLNPTGSTQYTITHNGLAAGSRVTLLDCFEADPTCVNPSVSLPANGASTVACLALATQPSPPNGTDQDGNPVSPSSGPSVTDAPNPLSCEGTRTYTWTYMDCAGTEYFWSYVYTIERNPFTISTPNGASTVACLAQAIQPAPPVVMSNCGETLNPAGPTVTDNPSPLSCEGTRTYVYTYTDCEGNTADWSFVYTIERNPFTISTPNGASTVACLAQAIQPAPPAVMSNCGETLNPAGPTVTDSPNLISCEGTRTYVYTYTDCEGNTANWSFVYTIERNPFTISTPNGASTVTCLAQAIQPAPPAVMSNCGETLNPAGPAVTDSPNPLSCEGTRTYVYTYTDCEGNTANWSFVYTIERNPFTISTPNGASTVACVTLATAPTPPTVMSNCGETLTPTGPIITNVPTNITCNGTRTYTYTYTDCEGNTADWSYVYTIDGGGGFNIPANDGSTVACIAQAVEPPAPLVTDACGNMVDPADVFVIQDPNPVTCEGGYTYVFRYIDCNENNYYWYYDYTIERNPFTLPANGAATVNCVSEATAPSLPTVTSDCGETLTPSGPVITNSPSQIDCGGSRTYAYTYTDCEGNTAVWSFVYTISPIGGVVKPADGASTVTCLSAAVEPTPPTVTNNCGVVLEPDQMTVTDAPDPITCEGTRTYTWNYFDCDENEFFWNYVYTIQRNPILLPADGASTVTCASAATTPTPPTVMGDCGETLTPTGPVVTDSPNPITCSGTRTYAYTYADCTGNSVVWSYVYTISPTGGLTLPPDGAETVACLSAVTEPTPPTAMGNCGETITPTGPVITDEPNPLSCSGTRTYTYTYSDCAGGTTTWNYVYTIDPSGGYTLPPDGASTVSCPALATMPTPPTVMDVCGNIVEHGGVEITENPDPVTCEGTITYSWNYSDCLENISVWTYTYTIERNPFTINTPNGAATVACIAQATQPAPPVVMSDCGETLTPTGPVVTDSPNPLTCEGTRTYTYTYTDCEGNSAQWSYVYTIERNPFTISTPNGASTVACPALATQPTPPTVMSDCGETLTPTGPSITDSPLLLTCEGTRTYAWIYTDCEGNQATWSYVYTIERNPFGVPANGSSTVACLNQATAPTPPIVQSNCGETLTPTGPTITDNPSPLTCEGTRTYAYTYTDCEGNQATWSFVYTIERNDFTVPTNGASTVACVALATPPTPPTVQSDCGETLTPTGPVITDDPSPLLCGGTRTYVYTYMDCEGNTHDWSYVYTITPIPFMVPNNGAATVACPALASLPTPPVVTDACGNAAMPSGPVITMSPDPLTCEGTVTYTWTYADCAGNMVPWSYVYTIERNDFALPANGSEDVTCVAQAVLPTPPMVQSDCGETLTPTGPVIMDEPSPLLCGGTRTFTWTYSDCEGNSHDWSFVYNITPVPFSVPANGAATVACPALAIQPTPPVVNDACGNPTSPTGPVISSLPSPVSCEGTVTYTWTYTDCSGNMVPWSFIYTIEREPFTISTPNGTATVACPALAVVPTPPTVQSACGETLTPTGPVIVDSPNPLTCEGTRAYTYTYTDCEGNSANWSFTYTIEREPFTIGTPNGTATVACPALATAPTALPTVTSNCGEVLTPSGPVVTNSPNPLTCEGTRTYTYTYTDCEGNTATWSFTYTIEREPFTISTPNGTATVACPAMATAPTALPTVTSNCGEVLTPTGPVVTNSPNPLTCEGTRAYTYTYTDCEGNTATWSFTYTIEREPFTISTPNGTATVACPALAVTPTPPSVNSNCGEPITPTGPVIVNSPNPLTCEGTRTYTYTYTDCEGNTANWSFTYTIEREPFTIPANGGTTVACPAQADVQPVPPVVTSNCGEVLTPVVTSSQSLGCEGNRAWNFTYTDCEGNTATWIFMYTVEYQDFNIPASEEVTVNCPINASQPTPPAVVDNCGRQLQPTGPVVTGSENANGCEAVRKYEWTYKDCEGNTHTWSKTYHFAYDAGDFFVYPDGETQVGCLDYAQFPPVPPTVYGTCGEEAFVDGPFVTEENVSPDGCSGTRKFTFIYSDCAGNSHPWSFTYHAVDNEPPVGHCDNVSSVNVTNLTCMAQVPCPGDYDFSSKIKELLIAGEFKDLCSGTNLVVELDSWSDIWQCSDADGDDINTFGRTFYFRIADQCGNEFPDLCSVTYSGLCQPLVTFTQEAWGNAEGQPGNSVGESDLQVIATLLAQGPLVVGGGNRSLTLTDSQCVVNLLPGVGGAGLLGNCHQNNCSGCNPYTSFGMKNSLAAQAITLSLNIRYNIQYNGMTLAQVRNQSLACLAISNNIYHCDEAGNCELYMYDVNGQELQFPATIGGLLDMANKFLGGNFAFSTGQTGVYAAALKEALELVNGYWDSGVVSTPCPMDAGVAPANDGAKVYGATPDTKQARPLNFSLAPNPAMNEVRISLSEMPEAQQVTFEMYNQLGQRVIHQSLGVVNYLNERVDLSGIKDGLYIVSLKIGDGRFEQKLVVLSNR